MGKAFSSVLVSLFGFGRHPNTEGGYMGATPSAKNVKGAPKKRGKFSRKFRPGLRSIEKKAGLWKKKVKPGSKVKTQNKGKAPAQAPKAPPKNVQAPKGKAPAQAPAPRKIMQQRRMAGMMGAHVHEIEPGTKMVFPTRGHDEVGALDPRFLHGPLPALYLRSYEGPGDFPSEMVHFEDTPPQGDDQMYVDGVPLGILDDSSYYADHIETEMGADAYGLNPGDEGYDPTSDPNSPQYQDGGTTTEDNTADSSYVPNGAAWVCDAQVQEWSVNNQGDPIPLHYPDGSPAMAKYYLPAMNLTGTESPVGPGKNGTWPVGTGPIGRWANMGVGGGNFGDTMVDIGQPYQGRNRQEPNNPRWGGYGFYQKNGQWFYKVTGAAVGMYDDDKYRNMGIPEFRNFPATTMDTTRISSKGTVDNGQGPQDWWEWPWDLNWFDHTPHLSYLFLRFYLPGTENQTWTAMPADIYRADGQDFTSQDQAPSTLPGQGWLDLNFLTAARLQMYGLPKLVRDDGSLDSPALDTFRTQSQQADTGWWRVLDKDPEGYGQSMLCLIYDTALAKTGVVPLVVGPNVFDPPAGQGGNYAPTDGGYFDGYYPPGPGNTSYYPSSNDPYYGQYYGQYGQYPDGYGDPNVFTDSSQEAFDEAMNPSDDGGQYGPSDAELSAEQSDLSTDFSDLEALDDSGDEGDSI